MAKAKVATTEPAKNTTTKDNKKQSKAEPVVKALEHNVAIDKDLQKQIQKLQRAIAQLEHNIETLQKEKLDIEAQMADPTIYSDTQKFHVVEKSYQDKNALIRSMNKEYEIAFNDLLVLESK
jgi:ATP-binding cassette subfamily F protein 3